MNPRFHITVGSLPTHEELVGDLYFDNQIVCLLTQEQGHQYLQIEIFHSPNNKPWEFPLSDFEEALSALKTKMWELRRV